MGALRALIEQPRRVEFWGKPYIITPLLCSQTFGDGRALLWVQPLATRPNYYVVRLDRRIYARHAGAESISELLEGEGVFDALEDDYGYLFDCDEDNEEAHGETEPGWPVLNLSCGYAYGSIRWRSVCSGRAR